ncbi:MAG: hypothetical protein U9Q22_06535 [Candidatus Altiarchaeota archaeon]|nr:hypothetical protein [Candidatus Altiarchaeota archaeon]
MDTVNLFIPPTSCVDERRCVNIYGYFELKNDIESFSLSRITEIHQKLNENPCLKHYFPGLGNNPVEVLWIKVVPCPGRIHDVGVPNDIILVRRKGCSREALGHMSERLCRSATKAAGSVNSNLKTVNSQADATGKGVSFGSISPDSNSSVANVINITNEGVLQK